MRTPDLTHAHWTKSSHSGNNGGDCLELALAISGFAPVRDSKHASHGPVDPLHPSGLGRLRVGPGPLVRRRSAGSLPPWSNASA
ncbi:protein of unknown function [Streptomyces sp. ScaeMP-6W]|nr:protein of unknown function [Streptomyces sp. ScaeMP-6W]